MQSSPLFLSLLSVIKNGGEPAEAEKAYQAYIESTDDPVALSRVEYHMVRYYMDSGMKDEAESHLLIEKDMMDKIPEDEEGVRKLATEVDATSSEYYVTGKLKAGMNNNKLVKEMYKNYPDEFYAAIQEGFRLLYAPPIAGGSSKKALRIFNDVEENQTGISYLDHYSLLVGKAMALSETEKYEESNEYLEKAESILKTVIVHSKVPVTLKIRKGWDKENIVAVEIAKIAEAVGVSAITIHGRTRSEFYTGKADLDIIKQVKESVHIPVIGNGDVVDGETAKKMFEYTGVDGIMIGRGTFGRPWIFKEIIEYLENGKKMEEPTNQEKLQIIEKHIDLAVEEKGEIAVKELRKHIAWYTKNLKNSSEFRNSINKIETKEELINKIEEYFKSL